MALRDKPCALDGAHNTRPKVHMTTFFTSDTHYGHDNVRKYSNRPFGSVEEMNETLIANHNGVVRPQDTVHFLGDFSFQKLPQALETLKRLNGHKHLVFGNHDLVIRKNMKVFGGQRCFETINEYHRISVETQDIILFHYALRVWEKSHHGSWSLHGHSHGGIPPHNKSVDVGVDSHWITGVPTYTPFAFETLRVFMATQEDEHIRNIEGR